MYYMTTEAYQRMVKGKREREMKKTFNQYNYNTPLTDFFSSRNENKGDEEIEMVEIKRNGK